MATKTETVTLGDLADAQAERNPRTEVSRGRVAGGGKPTSKPLVANGRPLRRFELSEPDQASEEVLSGYQPTRVIPLNAIGDMTIDVREGILDERLLAKDIDAECLSQPGDVVLSLSSPFPSACIDEETAGLFVPNTCAVIRMDKETREVLDPWYLVGYLNLEGIKSETFERKATSGTWKTLRIEDLLSIEIPLPPMDVQAALGKALQAHVKEIRASRARKTQRTELIEKAFSLALQSKEERE